MCRAACFRCIGGPPTPLTQAERLPGQGCTTRKSKRWTIDRLQNSLTLAIKGRAISRRTRSHSRPDTPISRVRFRKFSKRFWEVFPAIRPGSARVAGTAPESLYLTPGQGRSSIIEPLTGSNFWRPRDFSRFLLVGAPQTIRGECGNVPPRTLC